MVLKILLAVFGTAFVVLMLIAKAKKSDSVYKNDSKEKNPLEGKKVIFVENENDIENADGVRGHLEAIGESIYKPNVYEKYAKRIIDILLSFGGLVVLSPVFLGLSIAIKIDDPGPVLFTQKRIGQNKQYFKLHKFRSMKMSTPHDKPTHMLENPEQYITKVGKFIRAQSLDELPQIWDIFIGNMSVIGPRPGLWNQDLLIAERDKYDANDVKPGLTGWAQINGRDELEIPVKAKLDGEYVDNYGFSMDLKCFVKSVRVFGGDASLVEGGTGVITNNGIKVNDKFTYTDDEKFSVLMSVYYKENPKHFDEAIESILINQTCVPDEFVLVCDGKLTLELESVIEKYSNKFPCILKIIRLKENAGLGNALNYGMPYCSYELIARADSDDICAPYRFEEQIKFMVKNKDIGISSSYIDEFDEDYKKPKNIKKLPLGNDELVKMSKYRNPLNHMSVMFRKSIILSIGSYHHIPYVEDYELWIRAINNGVKLANIDKILVHARVGNGMVGRRGNRQYISSWKKMSDYMIKYKMINIFEYARNMISIIGFVYMPPKIKDVVYKTILRKG